MDSLYPARLLKDHAYAVIDRVVVQNIPQDWPIIPLVPSGLEKEQHLLPALLLCREMTQAQEMQLLELLEQAQLQGEPLQVVTFLQSEANQDRMRSHWNSQLLVRLQQGGRALLRSYDPRVFLQLQWMLQPKKLKELFGPITRWTVYQDGNWLSFNPPEADESLGSKLDAKQAERLTRIGRINQVLDKLPEEGKRDRTAASQRIDALLLRAKEHQLLREEEQVTFALHGMTIHPEFDQHLEIKRMIAGIDPEEQTYCDAAALLDETVWQTIAQELNTSTDKKTSWPSSMTR